eukprot:TRINITY_DN6177_c0_g1_i7.p1 TRINITY_DN6177_c0_g1~~TRINITY_DN6177_c0_g1_i7.p1  ORF type:complete len:561 (-),score=103.81 TRINITY_DN6177_c0_g1_i7:178-1860(-)
MCIRDRYQRRVRGPKMGGTRHQKPKVGLKAELRNARETKHLIYNTNTSAAPPQLAQSSNSIVWDLKYRKPKGSDQHKIEAGPSVVERLLRDKLQSKIGGACSHSELLKMFRHFDKDGSGEIELSEFKKMMSGFNVTLTHPAARAMFRKYDLGGDGSISFEEFKKAVMLEQNPSDPNPPLVCPADFGPREIDYMAKGGGRGLEITRINWHTGKIDATPDMVEKVLRQKLNERTGVGANFELRRAWNLFDRDGSKRITIDELEKVLKSFNLNLSNRRLREFFARYDVDGDGSIDQVEFEAGVLNGKFPKKGRVRNFAGSEDLTRRPSSAQGRIGPALKTGGLTMQNRSGMYSGNTPEAIERTLRSKLGERSTDRACHELHRIWQHYDKDFDHRVDISEFRQILVSFNIHPSDDCLRKMFQRYDGNDDGLIERDEFENAILNGVLPKGNAPTPKPSARTNRSLTSQGFHNEQEARKAQNQMLQAQRGKLEAQARETMALLHQAREVNSRVMHMQESMGGRRSSRRSHGSHRRSSMPQSRTAPGPYLMPLERSSPTLRNHQFMK